MEGIMGDKEVIYKVREHGIESEFDTKEEAEHDRDMYGGIVIVVEDGKEISHY
jgi:hypothetical protein